MELGLDNTQEDSLVDNVITTDQDGGSYNYENEEFCEVEEEDEEYHGEDVDEEDVSF